MKSLILFTFKKNSFVVKKSKSPTPVKDRLQDASENAESTSNEEQQENVEPSEENAEKNEGEAEKINPSEQPQQIESEQDGEECQQETEEQEHSISQHEEPKLNDEPIEFEEKQEKQEEQEHEHEEQEKSEEQEEQEKSEQSSLVSEPEKPERPLPKTNYIQEPESQDDHQVEEDFIALTESGLLQKNISPVKSEESASIKQTLEDSELFGENASMDLNTSSGFASYPQQSRTQQTNGSKKQSPSNYNYNTNDNTNAQYETFFEQQEQPDGALRITEDKMKYLDSISFADIIKEIDRNTESIKRLTIDGVSSSRTYHKPMISPKSSSSTTNTLTSSPKKKQIASPFSSKPNSAVSSPRSAGPKSKPLVLEGLVEIQDAIEHESGPSTPVAFSAIQHLKLSDRNNSYNNSTMGLFHFLKFFVCFFFLKKNSKNKSGWYLNLCSDKYERPNNSNSPRKAKNPPK